MIDLHDPFVRQARNNRRLKYWTIAIITFLAALNVAAMYLGGI